MRRKNMTPYEILGLPNNASLDEVKTAYKKLALQYSTDSSIDSPLREHNEAKMQEIDQAFDSIVSQIKTGTASQYSTSEYQDIRQLIQHGNADGAINKLNQMGKLENDAEWNFLMGSAYHYKGWGNYAIAYFEKACNLAPDNSEYTAAYNNINNNSNGNLYGNPYSSQPYSNAGGCSCCDLCGALMCADCLCSCGSGGCC